MKLSEIEIIYEELVLRESVAFTTPEKIHISYMKNEWEELWLKVSESEENAAVLNWLGNR